MLQFIHYWEKVSFNFFKINHKVYVISIEKDLNRWLSSKRLLNNMNIQPQKFSGVLSKGILNNFKKRDFSPITNLDINRDFLFKEMIITEDYYRTDGRKQSLFQRFNIFTAIIACGLSHLALWKLMIEYNIPKVN